jgi:TrmH family RNA methyltransferase
VAEGLITSRRNPLVGRLRQLHQAKGRRQAALLLLEGTHLLQEVLRLQLRPRELLATELWCERHGQLLAALPAGLRPQLVTAEVLAAVSTTEHPDGVVLTLEPPTPPSATPTPSTTVLVRSMDGMRRMATGSPSASSTTPATFSK